MEKRDPRSEDYAEARRAADAYDAEPVPVSVTFFPNGMAGVCDRDGNQIGKYQGRHAFTVEALAADGYDWRRLPDVLGYPNLVPILENG